MDISNGLSVYRVEVVTREGRGALRYRIVTVWVGLTLGLVGCTSQPEAARPEPQGDAPSKVATRSPATPSATTESPRPTEPGQIPVGVRVSLPTGRSTTVADSIVIDLAAAVDAPSVDDAPVEAGMLLAALNLFSTDYDARQTVPGGQPYLMTRAGQWRTFDLTRYGFKSPTYEELSMAISADGRDIAFAEPRGLVTVDLRDNTFKRYELPVNEAVGLEWSSDASTLYLKDRAPRKRPCGPKGCALNVSTGLLSEIPYDRFYSTHGTASVAFELKNATKKQLAEIITHREGMAPQAVPLQYLTKVAGGAVVASQQVAYAQCAYGRGARNTGVVVVDPTSGRAIAMLESPRRPACALGTQAWLSDRQLLVDSYYSGDIWLWDVPTKQVRRVAVGRTSGVVLNVASEVMAKRFSRTLQP